MAYKDHRWMTPDALPAEAEILEVYQTTRQFYQETQYREDLDRHCAWYEATAKQHCQEIEKMRGDINLFKFFRRQQ